MATDSSQCGDMDQPAHHGNCAQKPGSAGSLTGQDRTEDSHQFKVSTVWCVYVWLPVCFYVYHLLSYDHRVVSVYGYHMCPHKPL